MLCHSSRHPGIRRLLVFACFLGSAARLAQAQAPAAPPVPADRELVTAVQQLKQEVRALREAVAQMRSEADQYRTESRALRDELRSTRIALQAAPPPASATPLAAASSEAAPATQRIDDLEEQTKLLEGKIDEQYQTKVESGSKYRLRLSGMMLLNLFDNRGTFDNQDFPSVVTTSNPAFPRGSFGATLRQSEIGLEVFGPRVAGATTRGNLQVDFAGGFPSTSNGITSGLFRLRTGSVRMDWARTSLVAGQEDVFFSPLSPTSYASVAVPALSYAGNLWGWIPQVNVEHRFTLPDDSSFSLQAGILDNLVGEPPVLQWQNIPQAGQRSGQPAYASRVAWKTTAFGRPMTFGAGGYYSRQDWWYGRHVDGWAGVADWSIPLPHAFSLTGEFYRGRAIGGLGGTVGRSAVFSDNLEYPTTFVRPLNAIGGWSQLKFKASEKLEFNAAYGIDSALASDLRRFSAAQSYFDPLLLENRGLLLNAIFRPRSNLLLSAEYRHLRSSQLDAYANDGDQVNLIMGVLF